MIVALAMGALGAGCGSRIHEVGSEFPEASQSVPELGAIAASSPFAGDPVWLQVPRRVDGACRQGPLEVTRADRAGVAELVIDAVPEGDCVVVPEGHSLTWVYAGELDAGRYVVRCSGAECVGVERELVVLAADSDPGPLAPHWRIRIAVALTHPPGRCFGMPSPGDAPPGESSSSSSLRVRDPRLWQQLHRAYPDHDPELLLERAREIEVVQRSEDHWEYGYTSGVCCTILEVGGHVHIERDGTIRVDPGHVYESRHVPC